MTDNGSPYIAPLSGRSVTGSGCANCALAPIRPAPMARRGAHARQAARPQQPTNGGPADTHPRDDLGDDGRGRGAGAVRGPRGPIPQGLGRRGAPAADPLPDRAIGHAGGPPRGRARRVRPVGPAALDPGASIGHSGGRSSGVPPARVWSLRKPQSLQVAPDGQPPEPSHLVSHTAGLFELLNGNMLLPA